MTRETYRGRKLKVVKAKDGYGRVGSINGQPMPTSYAAEDAIIEQLRRDIDAVDKDPVIDGGRWGAYMYAPGTYELCANDHPKAPGGPCRHPCCQEKAAGGQPR